MALFDAIQDQMFDTVTAVYGYPASWTPSTGGSTHQAEVLLKDPTEPYDVNGVPYTPFASILEYRAGFFPGLFESAREKRNETVTVSGVPYWVRNVQAAYDGKTYRAHLEKKDA